MKAIPKATYPSFEELASRIKSREVEAALLPPGATRQSVLVEIAKLKAYAAMKGWLASSDDASKPRR